MFPTHFSWAGCSMHLSIFHLSERSANKTNPLLLFWKFTCYNPFLSHTALLAGPQDHSAAPPVSVSCPAVGRTPAPPSPRPVLWTTLPSAVLSFKQRTFKHLFMDRSLFYRPIKNEILVTIAKTRTIPSVKEKEPGHRWEMNEFVDYVCDSWMD